MAYKKNYKPAAVKSVGGIKKENPADMALGRKNFIFMAICGIAIVTGFLLMLGPGSTQENFEPDIFSTRRIVVGPTIAFLGFLFMAIAIIINPHSKKNAPTQAKESDEDTKTINDETQILQHQQ